MEDSSVFSDGVDLRETYPLYHRSTGFTVSSTFRRDFETKLEIHVAADDSLEIEMMETAAETKTFDNAVSSPGQGDPNTTTDKQLDESTESQTAQVTACMVGYGVALRRIRSEPVKKKTDSEAAMEALQNRLNGLYAARDALSKTPSSNDSKSNFPAPPCTRTIPHPCFSASQTPPKPTLGSVTPPPVLAAVPVPPPAHRRFGLGRLLGRKSRSSQMYTTSLTESKDDASTANTSQTSSIPRKSYHIYKQSLAHSQAQDSDALSVALEAKRKKEAFLQSPPLVVTTKTSQPNDELPRKSYQICQESLTHSKQDDSTVRSAAIETEHKKEECLQSPYEAHHGRKRRTYDLYQKSLSLSTSLDESTVAAAALEAERKKQEFLSRPMITPLKPPTLIRKTSKKFNINRTAGKPEINTADNEHKTGSSPSYGVFPVSNPTAAAAKSSPQSAKDPATVVQGLPIRIDKRLPSRNKVESTTVFQLEATTNLKQPNNNLRHSRDSPLQPQRSRKEPKRQSPPPSTRCPSPPPVTSVQSRLSVLVAVDSMEMEKRQRSQQRNKRRENTKGASGKGERYQMPLRVLSNDGDEEDSCSDTSETCSTSRRGMSLNSSNSHSTMPEGSVDGSDDEQSRTREEYADDEDPGFEYDTSNTVKHPMRSFDDDNSTLDSGSYFLNADHTYRMIDFYRLKNRRQRSSRYHSLNPGASWDNSEISDLFSQASHLFETSEILLGRSASAVSEALWETEEEAEDLSNASSAFVPLSSPRVRRSDSQSSGGGSAFVTVKPDKTEKARFRDLPNNLSLLSSGSNLESISENVDADVETERKVLSRGTGWLCWGL